jgi:hypothetical protein
MDCDRTAESPVTIFYSPGFAGEPVLSDLLYDPIAEVLMAADRHGHSDHDALLATARCRLRRGRPTLRRSRFANKTARTAWAILLIDKLGNFTSAQMGKFSLIGVHVVSPCHD